MVKYTWRDDGWQNEYHKNCTKKPLWAKRRDFEIEGDDACRRHVTATAR